MSRLYASGALPWKFTEEVASMCSTEQVGFRSWMRQRAGESARAYRHRLSHSCYRCGWFSEDMAALDAHEDRKDCPQRT